MTRLNDKINKDIKLVKNYFKNRYKNDYINKQYTICVLLWADKDYCIRLRHGNAIKDIEYHNSEKTLIEYNTKHHIDSITKLRNRK